jgi:single-stranded-DNA-specific exonuclease
LIGGHTNLKKWKQKKTKGSYRESDSLIVKLAAINGIEDMDRFMNPNSNELHDPYLLMNVELARNRIIKAIKNQENISIHSDIDSDGCNSTAIMFNYLKNFTSKLRYFHAQRSDGHGVYLKRDEIPDDTHLLIVVDSSSNENITIKEISTRGIDVIIIDHHTTDDKVASDHCILVNPQQEGCDYPNKDCSGSLLTWKVCQTIDDTYGTDYTEDLIDLAGLGLHSDQMSMQVMENRYLVNASINGIQNIGLHAILEVMDKKGKSVSASDYAFSITPFINAATRLDKIELVLELLTTEDPVRAIQLAKEIKKLNYERKKRQREAVERIIPTIDESDKCIVIVDESLGKNMNGLIASDLANVFQRPVVVLGSAKDLDDEYHGSFRSYGFFDFLNFVDKIPEALFSGGHKQAGGTGIKRNQLEEFKKSLNEGLMNENFEQVTIYDLELEVDEITEELINSILRFSRLSGNKFSEPRFLIKDLFVINKKSLANDTTLKIEGCSAAETWFMDEDDIDEIASKVVGMKFRTNKEYIDEFPEKKAIDVVGTLNINSWMQWKPIKKEIKTNQIFIEDFRVSN